MARCSATDRPPARSTGSVIARAQPDLAAQHRPSAPLLGGRWSDAVVSPSSRRCSTWNLDLWHRGRIIGPTQTSTHRSGSARGSTIGRAGRSDTDHVNGRTLASRGRTERSRLLNEAGADQSARVGLVGARGTHRDGRHRPGETLLGRFPCSRTVGLLDRNRARPCEHPRVALKHLEYLERRRRPPHGSVQARLLADIDAPSDAAP